MQGRRILGFGLSLVAAMAVSAAGPDEDYVRIYKSIVEADSLKESGRLAAAAKLYEAAGEALHQLQMNNPAWNERLIIFRINYVAGQLKTINTPPPQAGDVPPAATPPPPRPVLPVAGNAVEVENQLQQLRDENQGLRNSAARLEAKLREALSSQPATVDPREVEKLQNQMRDLTKENALLKVTLDHQQKVQPAIVTNTIVQTITNTVYSMITNTVVKTVTNRVTVDSAELAELRKGLTNQLSTLVILRTENDVLKKELAQAKANPAPPVVVQSNPDLEKQLQEAVRELKATQQANQDLVKKQSNLEQMLSDARAAQEAQMAKLKRFDELEKSLTDSKAANQKLSDKAAALEKKLAEVPPPPATDVETSRRLVKLEKDLLESQSEVRLLTRQKADLELRLSEARTAAAQQAVAAAGPALQLTPGAGGEAASTEMHRQLKQASWEVLNLQAKNSELVQKQTDLQQQLAKASSSKGTFDSIDADRIRRLEQMNKELSDTKQNAIRLEQENQRMALQLTEARQNTSKNPKDDNARRQLADAQAQLRQAEAANREMQKRSADLERQISELRNLAVNPVKDNAEAQNPEKIQKDLAMAREAARQLQEENRALEKKVSLAEQTGRSGSKGGSSKATERELALLRSRLEIIEAKAVPYSEEELALFSRLEVNIAATGSDASKDSPATDAKAAGVGSNTANADLVASARKDFDSGNFAEAERKFDTALKGDERNLFILAHLAASQFEQQKLAEAEKTTQKALAFNPEDAPSLYLLGIIRLRQDRLDEALDALGKSAKANPQNAVTQNHLGVALSQKGLRESAETAFRKSLQIRPDYPDAHYNLAVEYILQQPPSHKLAQWHYQKATAGGHPRNSELEKRLEAAAAAAASAK